MEIKEFKEVLNWEYWSEENPDTEVYGVFFHDQPIFDCLEKDFNEMLELGLVHPETRSILGNPTEHQLQIWAKRWGIDWVMPDHRFQLDNKQKALVRDFVMLIDLMKAANIGFVMDTSIEDNGIYIFNKNQVADINYKEDKRDGDVEVDLSSLYCLPLPNALHLTSYDDCSFAVTMNG